MAALLYHLCSRGNNVRRKSPVKKGYRVVADIILVSCDVKTVEIFLDLDGYNTHIYSVLPFFLLLFQGFSPCQIYITHVSFGLLRKYYKSFHMIKQIILKQVGDIMKCSFFFLFLAVDALVFTQVLEMK